MTAQRGKDLLLKLGSQTTPIVYSSIGGLRTRTLSLNAQTIDITHAQSSGGWRELLVGGGVRQASISGSGVFLSDGVAEEIRGVFFTEELRPWQIIIPGFGELTGPFQLTNLDYAGEYDGEATMSLALESAGEIIFSALGA